MQIGRAAGRLATAVNTGAAVELYDALSRIQFESGPPDAARRALLRELDSLKETRPTSLLREQDIARLRIIVLLRLWKIEAAGSNAEAAERYKTMALATCNQAKWRDCSEAMMQGLLRDK